MNPLTLLLGAIIAGVGIAFLGINMHWWSREVLTQIGQLWPVLLIIFGLRFVLRSSAAFLVASLVLLAIIASVWAKAPDKLFHSPSSGTGPTVNWPNLKSVEKTSFKQELDAADAKSLAANLSGNYDIKVTGSNDKKVSVDLEGPKAALDKLTLTKESGDIVLKQGDVSGNDWLSGNLGQITGTITLPKALSLNLTLSGITQVAVANYSGQVTIDGSGGTSVTFNSSTVINPNIKLSGAGRVALDTCSGDAQFSLSGAGEITAKNCSLGTATIDSSGGGKVSIASGSVANLKIHSSGASSVHVPKPSGTVEQDSSGAASIHYN